MLKSFLLDCEPFDVIVMYGLLHCLPSVLAISTVVDLALRKTRGGGHHIVATFNDGPHDLSAHPGFAPTLAAHDFYLNQYRGHDVVSNLANLFTKHIRRTESHTFTV